MKRAAVLFLFVALACRADSLSVSLFGSVSLPGSAVDVAYANERAYVAAGGDGIRIVDLADPTAPVEIFSHPTASFVNGLGASGNLLCAANYTLGLYVLDVTWPPPAELGHSAAVGYALDVEIAGDYAYVAQYDRGLGVFDISNPNSPVNVGNADTPGYAYDVAPDGDYCYIADRGTGLRVIDVSSPSSPSEVGSWDTFGEATGVAGRDGIAYVADGLFGLRIIDCSIPTAPTEIGSYNTSGMAQDVDLAGHYAFVADGGCGLRVIDVLDPSSPEEVGYYDTFGDAKGVCISGEMALIADGDNDLVILNVSHFTGIDEAELPRQPTLYAYPNPFNSACYIGGFADDAEILDLSGRRVGRLEAPGVWRPSRGLPSGIYFVEPRGGIAPRKITLIR